MAQTAQPWALLYRCVPGPGGGGGGRRNQRYCRIIAGISLLLIYRNWQPVGVAAVAVEAERISAINALSVRGRNARCGIRLANIRGNARTCALRLALRARSWRCAVAGGAMVAKRQWRRRRRRVSILIARAGAAAAVNCALIAPGPACVAWRQCRNCGPARPADARRSRPQTPARRAAPGGRPLPGPPARRPARPPAGYAGVEAKRGGGA